MLRVVSRCRCNSASSLLGRHHFEHSGLTGLQRHFVMTGTGHTPKGHAGQGNFPLCSGRPACRQITSMFDTLAANKPGSPRMYLYSICGLFGVVGIFLGYKLFERMIGRIIEAGVESFDRHVLGVDVEIDTLLFHLSDMSVELYGLHVLNPEGFKCDNLLVAKYVLVDLYGWEFFKSFGKSVIIENLHLRNVHLNVENTGSKSNLALVIAGKDEIDAHNKLARKGEAGSVAKKTEKSKPGVKDASGDQTRFELQNVQVTKIDISYSSSVTSCDLCLPDVTYDNFSKEMGSTLVDDLASVLVKTLMKNIGGGLEKLEALKGADIL